MWLDLPAAYEGLQLGFFMTLKLLGFGVIGGILLGTIIALARLSRFKIFSLGAKVYVNFFRSVPLLLVLLWFSFIVPMLYFWLVGDFMKFDTTFVSSAVAFMLFEAAYFAEIVRAGIQSIAQGQVHAAKSLGMTYWQEMRLVVLPQAFRKMLPLVLQQSIILFQDTTLVYAVGLMDFFRAAQVRGDITGLLSQYILFAGLVYFIISFSASYLVKVLQRRLRV